MIINYASLAMLLIVLMGQLFGAAKKFRERASNEGRMLAGRTWPSGRFFVHDATWQNLERAAQWISTNAQPDAVVATSVPHFLYLLSGRLAIIPPLIGDPDRARQLLNAVPVSYVIVDQLQGLDMSRTYARPAIESDPDHWRLAFTAGRTNIYARTDTPSSLQQP